MSSFLARVTSQQQLRYVPHTSVSGETWEYIKGGVTTSAGSAGGTTLIDTGGDSGAADTYNGAYYVEIVTGAVRGAWKRVVDDDGAGTLTFENSGFGVQIASGVSYRIWKSPEPVFKVTTSTSDTQFTCSARTEADDFWIGYECMLIANGAGGGPARGEIQTISDSTSAGVITVDTAFSAAPAVGDVLFIGKFIEFGNLAMSPVNEYIPRLGNRVNFGIGDGIVGPRAGTIGFSTEIRPSGTFAGDATVANKSVISGLFQAVGLVEYQDTTQTIPNADSTTTTIEIPAASEETFTIGNMVTINGESVFITGKGDGTGTAAVDQLTVTPPLSIAPENGELVRATCGYHKSTDADTYGVCIELELDGFRHTLTGCKGNVEVVDAVRPEMAWTFNIDHYIREIEAAPYGDRTVYATGRPVLAKDRIAYADTTKFNITNFTASPGTLVAPKSIQGAIGINGRAGYQLTGFEARASWAEMLDSSSSALARENQYQSRVAKDIFVILGSHASTFAVRLPVARLIEAPHGADQDGFVTVPSMWEAQDAGLYTAASVANAKVPDFAFLIS